MNQPNPRRNPHPSPNGRIRKNTGKVDGREDGANPLAPELASELGSEDAGAGGAEAISIPIDSSSASESASKKKPLKVSQTIQVPSPPPQPASRLSSSPVPQSTPPPPPIRSTLPPVRSPDSDQVASKNAIGSATGSGVGSAKGVRWKGELDAVDAAAATKRATQRPQGSDPSNTDSAEQDESQYDGPTTGEQVAREAPPWLVSMVVHLILLIVLALLSTPAGSGVGKLILNIGRGKAEQVSELTEFSIASEEVISDSDSVVDSEAQVDLADIFDSANMETLEQSTPLDLGVGMQLVALRPMFQGRSGAMKKALLQIYGGTGETQDAVKRGLEWLKRNQKSSGGWSMRGPFNDGGLAENEAAATAMALLAFLGDGHTHQQGDYQEVVRQGMTYLVKLQDRTGFFARSARGHEKLYAQAQATIAICELYGMTKDSWLRDRAQAAIDYAENAQASLGGWRYEPGFDSDTSVTGWFVMALASGRSAGLEVRESVFENVGKYLDSAASFDGAGYGYQARKDPTPAMTAEGLLCRQYLGWGRDRQPLRDGIDALLLDAPFKIQSRDVYYWYYATQVLHHYGAEPWEEWNRSMRVELPEAQVKSGGEDGSWPPQQDRWGQSSGRLFTTCLSIYCLEVYYRHMPLYQSQASEK